MLDLPQRHGQVVLCPMPIGFFEFVEDLVYSFRGLGVPRGCCPPGLDELPVRSLLGACLVVGELQALTAGLFDLVSSKVVWDSARE